MKNREKMTYPKYLLQHIIPALWSCYFYYVSLFVHIPDLPVNTSKIIYFLGNQAIWIILSILTPKKRRNIYSAILNVTLGYTPYFLITHTPAYQKFIAIYVSVIIILCVLYFAIVVFKKIKSKTNTRKIIKRRFRFAVNGIKSIAGVFCLVLLSGFMVCSFFGIKPLQSDASLLKSANEENAEQWTVKNNIDIVKLLRPDDWKELSADEKLNVLGVVRNIEVRYLGIPHEIYLATAPTDINTSGYYDSKEHTIVISYELLKSDNAEEALKTLCHEMHHAYAYTQIEVYKTIDEKYKNLLIFDGAKTYEKEFENYTSADDDVLEYLLQEAEIDAEVYAKKSVDAYYRLIDQYLNTSESVKKAQYSI